MATVGFPKPSDPVEKVEADGGGDVQRLQAESRRRVWEEDRECLLGVYQELRGIVSVLKAILHK